MNKSAPTLLDRLNPMNVPPRLKGGLAMLSAAGRTLGIRTHTPKFFGKIKSNRAAAADQGWFQGIAGAGTGWARTEYGEYYTTSVSVYAAIKLRAEALGRPQLKVNRLGPEGQGFGPGPIILYRNYSTGSTLGTPGATCGAPPRSI